jgi:ribosomal protein L44E
MGNRNNQFKCPRCSSTILQIYRVRQLKEFKTIDWESDKRFKGIDKYGYKNSSWASEENKVLKKVILRCGNCFDEIGVDEIPGYDYMIEKRSAKYVQFRTNRLEQLFGFDKKIDMKDDVDDADIPEGQSKD